MIPVSVFTYILKCSIIVWEAQCIGWGWSFSICIQCGCTLFQKVAVLHQKSCFLTVKRRRGVCCLFAHVFLLIITETHFYKELVDVSKYWLSAWAALLRSVIGLEQKFHIVRPYFIYFICFVSYVLLIFIVFLFLFAFLLIFWVMWQPPIGCFDHRLKMDDVEAPRNWSQGISITPWWPAAV